VQIPGAPRPDGDPIAPAEQFRRFRARLEEFGVGADELREALVAAPLFVPPAELVDA
jgi:hypothetical protein